MSNIFRAGTAVDRGTTCALLQLSAHPGLPSYRRLSEPVGHVSLFRLWHLPFLFCLLLLASCSAKQVQTSQETAETLTNYIKQAEATLSLFEDNYSKVLELFVDEQEKIVTICEKVDPLLVKAKSSLAAAKKLATLYASTPIPTTLEEFKTNWQACGSAILSAGVELAKLVKSFQ